jgi:hypothetical protein
MKYMLLINSPESYYPTLSEAEMGQLMAAYGAFTEEVAKAGVLVGADRLRPTSTATTVRVRDGETLTTDGPFAETKEQLGGYYTIDVDDIDEAIRWASKIPSATYGSIEVRPIWEE